MTSPIRRQPSAAAPPKINREGLPHTSIAQQTVAQQTDAKEQGKLNEKSDTLTQAKDRGQVTATGAMSVVHIALLRDLLNLGHDNVNYYTLMYTLIVTSLVLQIIAGVLSIMVANIRSYFSKHNDDFMQDFCENCFGCKCGCDADGDETVQADDYMLQLAASHKKTDGSTSLLHTPVHSQASFMGHDRIKRNARPCCGGLFCGCYVTNKVLEPYEYDVLDKFYAHQAALTKLELEGVRAEVEMKFTHSIIDVAKADLERLEKEKDKYELDVFKQKSIELHRKIQDARDGVAEYEDARMHLDVAEARGQVLAEKADKIRKNRIIKVATFWQNIINMIFYAVFTLNIIITGFGIAPKEAEQSAATVAPSAIAPSG